MSIFQDAASGVSGLFADCTVCNLTLCLRAVRRLQWLQPYQPASDRLQKRVTAILLCVFGLFAQLYQVSLMCLQNSNDCNLPVCSDLFPEWIDWYFIKCSRPVCTSLWGIFVRKTLMTATYRSARTVCRMEWLQLYQVSHADCQSKTIQKVSFKITEGTILRYPNKYVSNYRRNAVILNGRHKKFGSLRNAGMWRQTHTTDWPPLKNILVKGNGYTCNGRLVLHHHTKVDDGQVTKMWYTLIGR